MRNFLKHFVCVIHNLLVAEPQHTQALRDQVCIAVLIVMPLLITFMYQAIALHYQSRLMTIEVRDVIAKLMLSSEFETEQLAIPQKLSEDCFGGGIFLS